MYRAKLNLEARSTCKRYLVSILDMHNLLYHDTSPICMRLSISNWPGAAARIYAKCGEQIHAVLL